MRLELVVGLLLMTAGCANPSGRSGPSGPEICGGGSSVPLGNGICLAFEDNGRLDLRRASIEQVVGEAVPAIRAHMPVDGVTIRVLADPTRIIPELGFGGFTPNSEEVQLFVDPAWPNLAQSLATELFPLLAHELHHTMRHRTAGYGSALFNAMISEGLADYFSIEVAGVDPPIWSTALMGAELEAWMERASEGWLQGPYDHDGWFFGTDSEIPRWAGYSIGFELVRRFLSSNPTRRASDLFGEPALSFLPASTN